MFPEIFYVTAIQRIIYVSPNEYHEKVRDFNSGPLGANELIYVLDGNSVVHFNGDVLEEKAGTVRFLPQGPVQEYFVERKQFSGCIVIYFQADIPLSPRAFTADMAGNQRLGSLFRQILSVWNGKGDRYVVQSIALFYQIIDELEKSRYTDQHKLMLIEPAMRYISEHYIADKISVPHLAELCGISESYLSRIFVSRCHMPPKRYILHLKMEHAVELLTSGMFSVSRVAELLGYESIYHFSQAFKSVIGISPQGYMKKCRSTK